MSANEIPALETDPKKARFSLRKPLIPMEEIPIDPHDTTPIFPNPSRVMPEEEEDVLDEDVMDADDLNRMQHMKEPDEMDFDLSQEYQRPSLEQALENRKIHMPTKRDGSLYPIWSTRTGRFVSRKFCRIDLFNEGYRSELIAFGSGISAYFKLQKSFILLSVLISLLSIPLLVINVNGGDNFAHHPVPFATSTLGNLYPGFSVVNGTIQVNTEALLRLGWFCNECSLPVESFLFFVCIWDVAIMMVFWMAINILVGYTMHETNVYKRKIPKIEDYSIKINVPLGADAQSIRHHFECGTFHSSVKCYDVQVVESTGNAISLCVHRGFLLKKLARADAKGKVMLSTKSQSNRNLEDQIKHNLKIQDRLTKQISSLDERAQNRTELQQGKQALMAFVTFDTQEAKFRVMDEYEFDHTFCDQATRLKFQHKHRIKIENAPPPSTVLWENLEVTKTQKTWRFLLSFLLFFSILALTAALTFVADSNRVISQLVEVAAADGSSVVEMCHSRYDNYTNLEEQVLAVQVEDIPCFCDYLPLNPLNVTASNIFVQSVCNSYWESKATSLAKEFGFSFLILVVNLLIYRLVVFVATKVMRFSSVLSREFAIMRVIFVISFLNTGFITLFVNTNWAYFTGFEFEKVSADDGTVLVQSGDFEDFEPGWYAKVGVEIFLIAILNIFGPYVLPLVRYLYHMAEQRIVTPLAISQQVLNDLYLGEEFWLSVRLAQTLTMIFFTLLYSSGIPLLYFIALCSFVVGFWVDKIFFLRLARTPPQFDTVLQVWALRALEWAVVLHCLFGFWMYSSPRNFPLATGSKSTSFLGFSTNSSSLNTTSDMQIENVLREFELRFSRSEPLVLLFMALFVIVWKILRRFGRFVIFSFRSCFRCCFEECRFLLKLEHINRRLNQNVMNAEKFHVALGQGKVAGVRSYNILANPAYQLLFQMQHSGQEKDEENASGFHSLQDALNIRKETAVDSIHARSIWSKNSSHSLRKPKSGKTEIRSQSSSSLGGSVRISTPQDPTAAAVVAISVVDDVAAVEKGEEPTRPQSSSSSQAAPAEVFKALITPEEERRLSAQVTEKNNESSEKEAVSEPALPVQVVSFKTEVLEEKEPEPEPSSLSSKRVEPEETF